MLEFLSSLFRHAEWRPSWTSKNVVLISGESASGLLMRRYVRGWQYRRPSWDEEFEFANNRAW